MDLLNCDGGNTAQIATDMAQLKSIGAKWVRIEASTTAETGLPSSPTCPKLPALQGLRNMLKGVEPHATVVIGGLSSWQAQCWTQKLGQHGAYHYADAIAYHPYGATPSEAAATLGVFQPIVKSWPKLLAIWITEFGFTTGDGSSRVGTEQVKASNLAQTYRLLSSRVNGPILYYTARDWPLTTAQWKQQCGSAPCVLDKPGSNAGHIPGTERDVSGSGLFAQLDGRLVQEPAEKAFDAAARAP
jgi:hypothetical protein